MSESHWVTIVKTQDGCDCVDKESGTNHTTAEQKDRVRWHNDLNEEVILGFERGRTPFDTDKIRVPANGNSEDYEVLENRIQLGVAPRTRTQTQSEG
jgi:hypothetical protein